MTSNSPLGIRAKPIYRKNNELQSEVMIIGVAVDFKEIIKQGKSYEWPRPASCSKCGKGLWGHGYVWRYFEESSEGCWIKRYRCPDCHQVITMRPQGYWPRFQKQSKTIHWILAHREKEKHWPLQAVKVQDIGSGV